MIDIHQLRHYVKAMDRTRKSLALLPVLAAFLAVGVDLIRGLGRGGYRRQPQQPR